MALENTAFTQVVLSVLRKVVAPIALLFCMLQLQACGQKGGLYLPAEPLEQSIQMSVSETDESDKKKQAENEASAKPLTPEIEP